MVSKAISIPDTYARVVTTTDDNNTNCCQNWKALLCSEEGLEVEVVVGGEVH